MMRKKQQILTACLLLAVFVLTGCTIYTYKPQVEIFTPGAYVVTVDGYHDKITVKTTFDRSRVTEIDVLEHREYDGLAYVAMQQIADEIIIRQSFAVDVVTGATRTCWALLEAVSTAAREAGADVEILTMPASEVDSVSGASEDY